MPRKPSNRQYAGGFVMAAERVDIPLLTAARIGQTTEEIIRLEQEQMYSGRDSNDHVLYKYKNRRYAQKKARMNPNPGAGNADFYLSGDFYKQSYVNIVADEVVHGSRVPYAPYLLKKNAAAMGLNKENLHNYRLVFLLPYMREQIAKTCFRRA